MSTFANPHYFRRKLRTRLRRAREARGLLQREVAAAMDWSPSKVIRIENGGVKVSTNDLKALMTLYGITDNASIEDILATAKASRLPPWWNEYIDLVDPDFGQQLGFEASASQLYIVYNSVIPGLLQTRRYATSILETFQPGKDLRRLVDLRLRRQELYDRPEPPEVNFILGEAALHVEVGGPEVLRDQLLHLIEVMDSGKATIEIIPFSEGSHPGLIGPFELMAFDDGDGDVVSFETPVTFTIIKEEPGIVSAYRKTFEAMREKTIKGDDARQYIQQLIDRQKLAS